MAAGGQILKELFPCYFGVHYEQHSRGKYQCFLYVVLLPLRLLVTDVRKNSRTNPLRAIRWEHRDQAWTNCHHLSLGDTFFIRYHREPSRVWLKLSLYLKNDGNRTIVRTGKKRPGSDVRAEKTKQEVGGSDRNNIFLLFIIIPSYLHCGAALWCMLACTKNSTVVNYFLKNH